MALVEATSSCFLGLILVLLGVFFLFGSIFPLNLDRYKEWTIEQLYYLLYPYIKEDFMGRLDCRAVHSNGNMIAGESSVSHLVTQGGSDSFASIQGQQYEIYVQEGTTTLDIAREQGEFTGRARGI